MRWSGPKCLLRLTRAHFPCPKIDIGKREANATFGYSDNAREAVRRHRRRVGRRLSFSIGGDRQPTAGYGRQLHRLEERWRRGPDLVLRRYARPSECKAPLVDAGRAGPPVWMFVRRNISSVQRAAELDDITKKHESAMVVTDLDGQ